MNSDGEYKKRCFFHRKSSHKRIENDEDRHSFYKILKNNNNVNWFIDFPVIQIVFERFSVFNVTCETQANELASVARSLAAAECNADGFRWKRDATAANDALRA